MNDNIKFNYDKEFYLDLSKDNSKVINNICQGCVIDNDFLGLFKVRSYIIRELIGYNEEGMI